MGLRPNTPIFQYSNTPFVLAPHLDLFEQPGIRVFNNLLRSKQIILLDAMRDLNKASGDRALPNCEPNQILLVND